MGDFFDIIAYKWEGHMLKKGSEFEAFAKQNNGLIQGAACKSGSCDANPELERLALLGSKAYVGAMQPDQRSL